MITKSNFIMLLSFFILSSMKPNAEIKKVFVIGDSISIHYGPYLKESLKGYVEYDRKRDQGQALSDLDNPIGGNGGDSKRVLQYLESLLLEKSMDSDFLLINCSLHDIKKSKTTDSIQISIVDYQKNLKEIIKLSKKLNTKLIWVNSTPVFDEIHNKKANFFRYNKDILAYNKCAEQIMLKNKIPIIDLYTFTLKLLPDAYIDHVHFDKPTRQKQADFIAGNIVSIIARSK